VASLDSLDCSCDVAFELAFQPLTVVTETPELAQASREYEQLCREAARAMRLAEAASKRLDLATYAEYLASRKAASK